MARHKLFLLGTGILFALSVLSAPHSTFATSGACSDHGGVNCAAGAGANGQVICNDGWTGSSVSYVSMEECQAPQPASSATSFDLKQECASYTSAIQSEITTSDAYAETNRETHPDTDMVDTLGEVFYSPVSNSCLYTQTIYAVLPSVNVGTRVVPGGNYMTYEINDYLDNDTAVYEVTVAATDTSSSKITDFYNEVDYYKGDAPVDQGSEPTNIPTPTASHTSRSSSGVTHALATVRASAISSQTASSSTGLATATSAVPQQNIPTPPSSLQRIFMFLVHLFRF